MLDFAASRRPSASTSTSTWTTISWRSGASAGASPGSNSRSPIHASASARRTVRDGPRMNVHVGRRSGTPGRLLCGGPRLVPEHWYRWPHRRGTCLVETSPLGRPPAPNLRCPTPPPAAPPRAPPSAESSALRMRAPISGGNRPCSTTVPSSSCQKVRPRFSCWASARSVLPRRASRGDGGGRTSPHVVRYRAVRC